MSVRINQTEDNFTIPVRSERLCIIGNLNIDLVVRGIPHFPEWGQEVIGHSHQIFSSGQAGYMALASAALGNQTGVIGNVGNDVFGKQIIDDLAAGGVNVDGVKVTLEKPTGITVAIVRPDGERAFVTDLASLAEFDEELIRRQWEQVGKADVVCMVGIFLMPKLGLDAVAKVMKDAVQSGKITVLDTGWDPDNWSEATISSVRSLLRYTTIFLPNLDELRVVSGYDDPDEGAKFLLDCGAKLVVVKLGPQGSMACQGDRVWRAPAFPTKVYDTVGAGDVFDAGFLRGLYLGRSIQECLLLGNASSSLYISRAVNRFPKLSEVMSLANL